MHFSFPASTDKKNVFSAVADFLNTEGFTVINVDDSRPWGGFFVIEESQAAVFIKTFFASLEIDSTSTNRVSPKILIVEPGKRLSWQYHHRRSEVWTVISDEVNICLSDTDDENIPATYSKNDVITIKRGARHRLIGLNKWGMVAEIWHHTDAESPTDENDIVRLQDDYGR